MRDDFSSQGTIWEDNPHQAETARSRINRPSDVLDWYSRLRIAIALLAAPEAAGLSVAVRRRLCSSSSAAHSEIAGMLSLKALVLGAFQLEAVQAIEAASRDTEAPRTTNLPARVLRNETELHVDSFTK